ncbi:class I SAM-dependent methyltransferase [Nesterenkonia ebinurensis]|uniref:class I SAM-dependent methyltransferase n=1 Tax=Nesterenkonia ebinurensis TaxID=2608252 RepID=UPI00123DC432|nr:class I SAM-dependent methyltransferase [Nesterenkonia ebinurensis]
MHTFDKNYWEKHWDPAAAARSQRLPVNPYLATETAHLSPGAALDAGCGTGAEALWLAERGWQVTGADISTSALAAAAARADAAGMAERTQWVEADLTSWEPERRWELVVTSYAHPETGQLALYQRLADWVAPGGTVLIVAHLHHAAHSHPHPEGATADQEGITGLFSRPGWSVETTYQNTRTLRAGGREVHLHDVIVRARRTS